jgi:type 1 glutamine amidotransferase
MKVLTYSLLLLLLVFCGVKSNAQARHQGKVLVFSLTKGYHHASIKEGIEALVKLGSENDFLVDTTTSTSAFNHENLKQYKALIFLSPTGSSVFSDQQKLAFKNYINSGGSLVGIHAATDFCYEWKWYGKLIGAYFESHPAVQKATLLVRNPKDKLNKQMPLTWQLTDEWYNFKNVNTDLIILLTLDENSYKGGKMGNNHPASWYHEFDGGKVFYTVLGHNAATYTNPLFLKHLLAGINWAIK